MTNSMTNSMTKVATKVATKATTVEPPKTLDEARAALASEWRARAPGTPDEIHDFYVHSQCMFDDLRLWHNGAERLAWTNLLVQVVSRSGAKSVLDIGCGLGDDLEAVARNYPLVQLFGVEPNLEAAKVAAYKLAPYPIFDDVEHAPVETMDLLVCLDVLEHVVDPETFLGNIVRRARVGALLVEATATHDTGTPLHLKENRGWHPGHCLEANGWLQVEQSGRVRVWKRFGQVGQVRASLLLCAYRGVSIQTMKPLMALAGAGWRIKPKWGDALISRIRSKIVTEWWARTADDVFLMIDDDIIFKPADADRIVAQARQLRGIVCAAYPVRDGTYLAVRTGDGMEPAIGPGLPLVELEYGSTGFMAVHRSVIDVLALTLPLCHESEPWAFRPFFMPMLAPMGDVTAYLSEDWAFCRRARMAGIKIWLDPTIELQHLSVAAISARNMDDFAATISSVNGRVES